PAATPPRASHIDTSRVTHVYNFAIPSTADAYTHRIGRTGRASRTGEAFTFITRDDAREIRQIEKELGPIERISYGDFRLDEGPALPKQQGRQQRRQPRRQAGGGQQRGGSRNGSSRGRSGRSRRRGPRGPQRND